MLLRGVVLFLFAIFSASAQNGSVIAPAPPRPLTLGERALLYTKDTFGPGSLVSAAAAAGYYQLLDAPEEWGQGMAGFGRRFGNHMAGNAISNTIEFGVSALRHEDTRYGRSGTGGFWTRARHVVVRTFMVSNEHGGTTFAASRIAGAAGSAFAANAWYPDRLSTTRAAVERSGWSIVSDLGTNAFHEFWPDVRRKLFKRR